MSRMIGKLDFYREPQELFAQFFQSEMAVFLDSSLQNEMGKYSIIGISPGTVLCETDGICKKNGQIQKKTILQLLEIELEQIRRDYKNPYALPLTDGAIGYFSYDYGRKQAKIKDRIKEKTEVPDACFVFYDCLILADLEERQLYVSAKPAYLEQMGGWTMYSERLKRCPSFPCMKKRNTLAVARSRFSKEHYIETLHKMIKYMEDGHIYVANMTRQFQVDSKINPYDAYCYLRTYNPAPFSAYLNYGTFQVLCSSPERFLLKKGTKLVTRPIKGTRKRGTTQREDAQMRLELEQSKKDRSELLMIMDLERNDFNRICVPGSVEVTEPFVIETYATVFHLVSEIQGEVRKKISMEEFVSALFPGGSITGAPKIRAMEIIEELELERRGLYTGNIGYFAGDGNCDFNIVIRTAVHKDGQYKIGAGGGITFESDVAFEYEETLQKAKAVMEALCDEDRT